MSIDIRPNPASAGSVTGGLVYKGSYDAALQTPNLVNSLKGDFYIVSDAGSLAGIALNIGDHIVFNQDASAPITSAMFDVIDNTDAVASVNGLTGTVTLDLKTINDVNATLSPSDSTFLVGDGSEWIGESGATARTSLGLGSAATLEAGANTANQLVQLTAAGKLPAVDGSLLTNISATDSTRLLKTDNLSDLANAATARSNLGVAIGSDVQAFDAQLTDIAGLTPTDSHIIVGDGSNFVTESGATARTSLGLTIGSDVQAFDAQLTDVAGLTPADGAFIIGDGSNFVTESGATARTSLGLGSAATLEAGANTANQLVQLTAAGKLPAVDGSLLTNISATDSTRLLKTENLNDLPNKATARSNLGVAIGSDVQAFDAQLTDIAGLTPTDSHIIVGDGSNFVTESGATARTSLGLSIGSDVQAYDAQLDDVAGLTPADGAFIVGDGSNFVVETLATARTSLGCGSAATFDAGANSANQLVQLTAAGKLPAVDGSLLTNVTATETDTLNDVVGRGATTSTPITVGDLKINSNAAGTSTSGSIATLASNNNIKLDPHGSGKPELIGNATRGSGQIQFNCEQNSHGIILKGPPHSAGASYTMILPDALGSNGQFLQLQDSSTGELTFAAASSSDTLDDVVGRGASTTTTMNTGTLLPSAAGTYFLGSSSKEWHSLYLKDSGIIYWGDDNDTRLIHDPDDGLILKMSTSEQGNTKPKFTLEAGGTTQGSELVQVNLRSSPAANDVIGYLIGNARQSGNTFTDYTQIESVIIDPTSSEVQGAIVVKVKAGESNTMKEGLKVFSDDNSTVNPKVRISNAFTLPSTDGSANQVLQTNGSGTVTWEDQSGGGGATAPTVTTDSSGTNTTISTSTGIEEIHLISNGAAAVTITIPTASTVGSGYKYNIKRLGTANVTVQSQSISSGNNQIDGGNSYVIATTNQSVTLVSNGTTYFII